MMCKAATISCYQSTRITHAQSLQGYGSLDGSAIRSSWQLQHLGASARRSPPFAADPVTEPAVTCSAVVTSSPPLVVVLGLTAAPALAGSWPAVAAVRLLQAAQQYPIWQAGHLEPAAAAVPQQYPGVQVYCWIVLHQLGQNLHCWVAVALVWLWLGRYHIHNHPQCLAPSFSGLVAAVWVLECYLLCGAG